MIKYIFLVVKKKRVCFRTLFAFLIDEFIIVSKYVVFLFIRASGEIPVLLLTFYDTQHAI